LKINDCGNVNSASTQTYERSSCKERCCDRDFAQHMAAVNEAEMRERWGSTGLPQHLFPGALRIWERPYDVPSLFDSTFREFP
jgi:hypothetical protein